MLTSDEEIDYLDYQRYLSCQSDVDLHDILRHLDPVRCPRRSEAVSREIGRRNLHYGHAFQNSETLWRKFLVLVIALAGLTFLLGLTMSREEAVSSQPPPSLNLDTTGYFVQFSSSEMDGGDQMSAAILGIYVGQLAENCLRDAVLLASRSGAYLLVFCLTTWKLVVTLRRPKAVDPLGVDVRNLLIIAFALQALVVISAAWNNLPLLANEGHAVSGGFLARAVTILAPWG